MIGAATVPHADFFEALFPDVGGGLIEARALPSTGRTFVEPGDVAALERFIRAHSHENLYFGVATRRDNTSGELTNCRTLHALFVDLDFKATSEAEARARLERFLLPPSIVVASGGGLHVYYLLREPFDLQAPGEAARAKGLLRRLGLALCADLGSAEAAHILRIPGTLNRKPEYETPRPVLIEVFNPDLRYNPSDLDDLLPMEPEATTNGSGHGLMIGEKIKDGERNTTFWGAARSMKRKGFSLAATLAGLRAENQAKCQPPLPDAEIEGIVKHAYEQPDRPEFAAPGDASASEPQANGSGSALDLSEAVVDYKDLLSLELPALKRHLPWLPEKSTSLIFGERGIGKTMAGLGLATALPTGQPFLKWPVSGPVGVLYVDGEMALEELRTRATALLTKPPIAPLVFLTSELVFHKLNRDLTLTDEATRAAVTRILEANPAVRVVIFDNISSLFNGIDEDSKRAWEPVNAWLIKLRHRGLATVLIHHAGKGGQQRGTSGREDAVTTVIKLERPAGYDPREGCRFELRFTKSRSVKGEDVAPLDVRLGEYGGRFTWIFTTLEDSKLEQAKALLGDGVTSVSDIAEELGISRGYASKLLRKARGTQ